MAKNTIKITCTDCQKEYSFDVFQNDLIKYQNGAFVQDAFPYLANDERELFISRICGVCFDEMFGSVDEDDENEWDDKGY